MCYRLFLHMSREQGSPCPLVCGYDELYQFSGVKLALHSYDKALGRDVLSCLYMAGFDLQLFCGVLLYLFS